MSIDGAAPARSVLRAPANLLFFAALCAFVALVMSQADFIPIWDGRIYADCVVHAASSPWSFEALRCGNHPTQGYVVWLAVVQRLSPGSFPLMLATNAALGVGALVAFHRILACIFPRPERAVERSALTFALAVHPAFISSAVQINVDYGVMVFGLVSLAALLERRVALAAIAGLLMAFSKETGAMLYGATIGLYWLVFVARGEGTGREKWRATRALAPLLLPIVAIALYLVTRSRRADESAVWLVVSPSDLVKALFTFDPAAPMFGNCLVLLFVVDFLWLPSAILAMDGVRGALGFVFRAPTRAIDGVDATIAQFLAALALTTVFLITRVPIATITRYLLPAYPILLLAFAVSMSRLGVRPALRLAIVALTALLLFASNFATIEPLSRRYFHTWAFGEHELLDMLTHSRECCGKGRDQLAYNLEFTSLHYLQNQMFEEIRPTPETTIAIDPRADWYFIEDLDPVTFHRSLHTARSFRPRVVDATVQPLPAARFYATAGVTLADLTTLPNELYYVSFPNIEPGRAMKLLSERFVEVAHKEYTHQGHSATLYKLVLRAGATPPAQESEPAQ